MKAPQLKRRNLLGAGALVAAAGLAGTAKAATTAAPKTTPTVFDFGAAGDGVSDDSAAFGVALQWASSNGRVVLVPGYDYAIGSTIKWQSQENVGNTWGLQCQGARLVSKIGDGSDILQMICNHTVRYFQLTGGLKINGNGSDMHGVHIYCPGQTIFFYNFLIDSLSVEGVGGHGLLLEGDVFESTVQNSYFQDCKQNGATFANAQNGVLSAMNVVNCFFNQNGKYGLACVNSDADYGGPSDVRVYGGYCRQNGSYGFYYNNGTGAGCIQQVGFENNCTSLQPGDPNGAHVYGLVTMNMRDCSGYNMFGGATYLLRGWFMGTTRLVNCGQGAGGQMADTGASRLVQVNGNANGYVSMQGCSGGVAVADSNAATWRAVECHGPSPLGDLNPTGTVGTV
jgi:hypothetical protein